MIKKNCPYEIVDSEIHEIGRVTVVKDTIRIDGKTYPYTYVVNRDSVCILPIYRGNVVVIEQYRHTLDQWMLELPAGGIDFGETSEEAARRELKEETGFVSGALVFLGEYFMNQGISSAKCDLYFTECEAKTISNCEKTELIHIKLIPIDEFDRMIYNNEFKLLIGMTGWYQAKKRGLV